MIASLTASSLLMVLAAFSPGLASLLVVRAAQGLAVAGVAGPHLRLFGAHSIASGWVGQKALTAKVQASALYLLCYYLGSSIGGSGGLAYSYAGWPGLVAIVSALLVLALNAARLTSP